ncbi:MAG: hypothetical protein LBG73_00425 [Spirochaetaceae bacterium]|jgi:hypothetical protein|nr:hypothetical protein [Spirochaetaceae bacterium]
MFLKTFFRALPYMASLAGAAVLPAQSIHEAGQTPPPAEVQGELPLRRLSLFSSGVGFFEHRGSVTGSAALSLPFSLDAVNDALKSLTINDPDSSPAVSYPSEETLLRTMKSLSLDILENPSIPALLDSLKGAEIEASAPNPIRGRVLFVEYRQTQETQREPYLSIYTDQGIKTIAFKDIGGFSFKDPKLNADLNRALDLIMGSRDSDTRRLTIQLPGKSRREVSLSYVIPMPVWKVSYRLDLSQAQPLLQGWAIVDNDGDTDWNNLELSLVTGRPVSFIQNLYAPYYLSRPVLPLAIAGIAEARTYESGEPAAYDGGAMYNARAQAQAMDETTAPSPAMAMGKRAVEGGSAETARGQSAGDQFEFTIKKPVTLARRQSAMLPLVEAAVQAEKTLVFSGANAVPGRTMNPAVSLELVNTTGMKLPAGPITVYDGGTYAGDALIEFFPEGETRLISYGEDLSVTGSVASSANRTVSAVTIRQGVMTISRNITYEKVYRFRNASAEAKRLIVEHPITSGAALSSPASYREKTDKLYRFAQTLNQKETLEFAVQEERPIAETITLAQLTLNSFVSVSSNQELPAEIRAALQTAITLKQKADAAKQSLTDMETRRTRLVAEQDRTRRNLEAAGNQTQQGQDYLKRLIAQDAGIDALDQTIAEAEEAVRSAQQAYDEYLAGLAL